VTQTYCGWWHVSLLLAYISLWLVCIVADDKSIRDSYTLWLVKCLFVTCIHYSVTVGSWRVSSLLVYIIPWLVHIVAHDMSPWRAYVVACDIFVRVRDVCTFVRDWWAHDVLVRDLYTSFCDSYALWRLTCKCFWLVYIVSVRVSYTLWRLTHEFVTCVHCGSWHVSSWLVYMISWLEHNVAHDIWVRDSCTLYAFVTRMHCGFVTYLFVTCVHRGSWQMSLCLVYIVSVRDS